MFKYGLLILSSWTLSGREAEALHLEEEDEESDEEDPIQKLLKSDKDLLFTFEIKQRF